jgi:diaminohydroxyphosphoribosylaminopyrimidine deaminase/5-amino-6-(5-phosphoribosylamino)uracil reductase
VHKWRSEEQSILVGTNTAIADNPKLNTRLWKGENPVRVVIDKDLKIPQESALFDGTIKTIVLTENEKKSDNNNLAFEKLDFQQDLPNQICEVLYRHNLQSVIIEGGAKTLQTFIDNNLWDEARVFTGISEFHKGVKAPEFSGKMFSKTTLERDTLKFYKND